jgi:hypothetical protein
MGSNFIRPTRCKVEIGEFDVPDTSCNVDKKWVFDQVIKYRCFKAKAIQIKRDILEGFAFSFFKVF